MSEEESLDFIEESFNDNSHLLLQFDESVYLKFFHASFQPSLDHSFFSRASENLAVTKA